MANFNSIKDSVVSALGVAAEKTKEFADMAADKAKDVSKITKLNLEIKATKDTIEKDYSELGKIYYETHKNAPEDYFVQLCEEITAANERITNLEREIETIKSASDNKSIEVELIEGAPVAQENDFAKPEESESEPKPEESASEPKPEGGCGCC